MLINVFSPRNSRIGINLSRSTPCTFSPSFSANITRRIHVAPRRLYSKEDKGKALEDTAYKAAEELKATLKQHPIVGTDNAKVFQNHDEILSKHYNTFYESVNNKSFSDDFEDKVSFLPVEKQKIYKDFVLFRNKTVAEVSAKYGTDELADKISSALARFQAVYTDHSPTPDTQPIRVAITGAAGAIGYAITFRIASGGIFGSNQPVILQLLELPKALGALKGVQMELLDCAFPNLKGIVVTDDPNVAFEGVDYALLIGAQPRTAGMERGDLLLKNAEIFAIQGKALQQAKGSDTRVLVVGNPANTNALIASHHAKNIPKNNFIAMTRLDHNRGLAKLAEKTNSALSDISRFIIWGNHSATQYPDVHHTIIKNRLALELINDDAWIQKTFIPGVQQRGAEIIKALGSSSAASAASAAIDTIHDWHFGTAAEWTSAAIHSSGEYGVTAGLYYSYPVVFNGDSKDWDIVRDLPIDSFSAEKMEATHKELLQERDGVVKYLPE